VTNERPPGSDFALGGTANSGALQESRLRWLRKVAARRNVNARQRRLEELCLDMKYSGQLPGEVPP